MKNHLHHQEQSLNKTALIATLHCLSGCAIGEIAGMVIGTALQWSDVETLALAIGLAFLSGYALTMLAVIRAGYSLRIAMKIALAADTASISIMEIVDNLIMLAIPGAMAAPLDSWLFWSSLVAALIIAGATAFPLNR